MQTTLGVGDIDDSYVYFAGGGGGGGTNTSGTGSGGAGGKGGGGNGTGNTSTAPGNGTANSGGGGGASGENSGGTTPKAGDGGSGVVLIRYTIPYTVTYNKNRSTTTSKLVPETQTVLAAPTSNSLTTAEGLGKDGFTFGVWKTAANGSGTSYPGSNNSLVGLPAPISRPKSKYDLLDICWITTLNMA